MTRRAGRTSTRAGDTAADLKELYGRKAGVIAKRPALGRGGGYVRVRLRDGLACQVEFAGGTAIVDLSPDDGGTGAGPAPDELARASLAAALAQSYRLWAARLDVPLNEIEVEVVSEHDARGRLGVSDEVAVGWQSLHVAVTAFTHAPEEDVRSMVALANRRSPLLANLSPAVAQTHGLTVVRPGPGKGTNPSSRG
ncbi:MAG TPA: OsmC family protein [Polyangia bacterium]